MGKLIYRFGTMNAAKSAHLLITGHQFEENGYEVIYLKSEIDTRDPGVIRSRTGLEKKGTLISPYHKDLSTILESKKSNKKDRLIILVDECQFLKDFQVDSLQEFILKKEKEGCNVLCICYGLRTDYETNSFEGSRRLFEVADSLEELKSSCKCGRKTIFNYRITKERGQIVPGNSYVALCRNCYYEQILSRK